MTTVMDHPLPPRAELLAGVWRLPLPLKDSPLGHVNTYLVRADDGYLLVDCGWDTADTLRALEGHLRALDIRLPDIRHLVITHIHPDHYGLAGRLREITSAELSFHRLERLYIESRYVDADTLMGEMREWLHMNGTPAVELDQLNRGSMSMMARVQVAFPDRTLDGGEEIPCGRYAFRVIWTPGHSAGHICLYDARHKVLLSGDHVLPHITPAVGLHVRTTSNPLADYMDSLRRLQGLELTVLYPGHGPEVRDPQAKIAEYLAHRREREDRLVAALDRGERSREALLAEVWDDVPEDLRGAAAIAMEAHLEKLEDEGRLPTDLRD